jgi:hypothetical protein
MDGKKRRPGRKEAAERRRVAREYLREFYESEEFLQVPQKYRLAMLELCPTKDSHPQNPDLGWKMERTETNPGICRYIGA